MKDNSCENCGECTCFSCEKRDKCRCDYCNDEPLNGCNKKVFNDYI